MHEVFLICDYPSLRPLEAHWTAESAEQACVRNHDADLIFDRRDADVREVKLGEHIVAAIIRLGIF